MRTLNHAPTTASPLETAPESGFISNNLMNKLRSSVAARTTALLLSIATIVAPTEANAGKYEDHCHMINNFAGKLKDGELTSHNFKVEANGKQPYTATDGTMFGICFYFPGDKAHPPHWQFNAIGPAAIYQKGSHDLDSSNILQCRGKGPCK